jgi:N-acetylglucosaminyl-diphospho-decaprenol L-rhamnosyltransferase
MYADTISEITGVARVNDFVLSEQPSVGIVVVNYFSFALLTRNIANSTLPTDVVVAIVDNSDDVEESAKVRELCRARGWLFADPQENIGFGAACNLGASALFEAGCESVLLLNPDAWLGADDLRALRIAHREQPNAMISPQIRLPNGEVWFKGASILYGSGRAQHSVQTHYQVDPEWITAACLLVPRHAWHALAGFDEEYFLYWEDVDLTYRWRKMGGDLRIVQSATAFHEVGATQGASSHKSLTYLHYNARNRIVFARRNLGKLRTLQWTITSPVTWIWLLRMGGIRRSRVRLSLVIAVISGTAKGLLASNLRTVPTRRSRRSKA